MKGSLTTGVTALALATLLGTGVGCPDSGDEPPAAGARELTPSAGLYAWDDLPLATLPMASLPALIDGDVATTTAIALGPADGFSFQNVGLDLGGAVAVDELRIVVRDATGQPVVSGDWLNWTVYTSGDGLAWTASPTTTSVFDPSLSQYALAFPSTEARFFKAMNFGTLPVPAYITELRALAHPTL